MDFFKAESEGGKAEAIRIYGTFCEAPVLVALHALADILQPVQRLQKVLQERGLSVYRLVQARQRCVSSLSAMVNGNQATVPRAVHFLGTCREERRRGRSVRLAFEKHELKDFPQAGAVQPALEDTGVVNFLTTLSSSLVGRFKEDCDAVVERFQVFDPAAFDGTILYGNDELQDIASHFSSDMLSEQCFVRLDLNQLMADWSRFKFSEEYRSAAKKDDKPGYCASQETFWAHFFLEGSGSPNEVASLPAKDRYCELFKVVVLAIVMVTNNAEAERAFSCMNRVCSDARSCLTVPRIESLMLISRGAKLGATGEFPNFHRHRVDWDSAWKSYARQTLRRPGDMAPVAAHVGGGLSKMERRGGRPRKGRKAGAGGAAAAAVDKPSDKSLEGRGLDEPSEEEEDSSAAEESEEEDEPHAMTEIVDWGPMEEKVQFCHHKVNQERRRGLFGWTFHDDGKFWVVLELGYALKSKKLHIFYVDKARLQELFPGRTAAGQPPTFTEVFQALEAQTQSMSEAEVAAAEDLPLDDIQWTKLAEAEKLKWVPPQREAGGPSTSAPQLGH